MNKIPFEYGSIAENEYFIDRIEDYERHRGAFEYAWNLMADSKYANHFMKINTSKYSPVEIAEMVTARLKELNSVGD